MALVMMKGAAGWYNDAGGGVAFPKGTPDVLREEVMRRLANTFGPLREMTRQAMAQDTGPGAVLVSTMELLSPINEPIYVPRKALKDRLAAIGEAVDDAVRTQQYTPGADVFVVVFHDLGTGTPLCPGAPYGALILRDPSAAKKN